MNSDVTLQQKNIAYREERAWTIFILAEDGYLRDTANEQRRNKVMGYCSRGTNRLCLFTQVHSNKTCSKTLFLFLTFLPKNLIFFMR